MAYKNNSKGLEMADVKIQESDVDEVYAAAIKPKMHNFESAVHRIEEQHGQPYAIGALVKAREKLLDDVPGMVTFDGRGHAIMKNTSSNDAYLKGNEWIEHELRKKNVLK
ncbi:MAG: hypothetical protein ABIF85_00590 [Nanoarchaeota archaeon]|nr:hypothetical protein [Nanoarchaeota archaeon]